MKAPSALCLRALRCIALPDTTPICVQISRRGYASLPERPNASKPPPPPPAVKTNKPPAESPGYKLREKKDDDEDFTPVPLSRPIGMPNPPQSGENMGVDPRTLRQRRDDFVDYEKHLARRAKMTKQIAKPYFRDWSNMRFHKGKQFIAPERLFRSEHALFFPNFFGKTLRKDAQRANRRDGYKGMGRDTSEAMRGKISVVKIVSSQWAANQVDTFTGEKANPGLHETLNHAKDVAQIVNINREENFLRWWILQLFSGNLRKGRSPEDQGRYFMVRRGVSDMMKEAIGLLNDKTGYVYLVDEECKIRWAGSALAEDGEKESLVRGLRKLIQDVRLPKEKVPDLEEAVAEVIEEPKAAASG